MTKTYPYAPCTIFTYQTGWFCSGKCWDSYSTHDGICNLAMQMSTDLRIPPESTRADLTAVTNRYWPGLKRTKFPWRNPALSDNAGDPTEKRSFGGDMMGLLLDDTGCVALSENDWKCGCPRNYSIWWGKSSRSLLTLLRWFSLGTWELPPLKCGCYLYIPASNIHFVANRIEMHIWWQLQNTFSTCQLEARLA
jgi:hypothetical protein